MGHIKEEEHQVEANVEEQEDYLDHVEEEDHLLFFVYPES